MSTAAIFRTQLVVGLLVWGIFVAVYWWPVLAVIGRRLALRQIAMLNAFRFEGLLFLMPAFVGQGLPLAFAAPAAYGDFATAVLAIVSIVTFRWERVALLFTILYTAVGSADLINNVHRVTTLGIGQRPESLGVAYVILIAYVPLLMITHGVTLWLLLRPGTLADPATFRKREALAPRI